jgi:hypothetical protein
MTFIQIKNTENWNRKVVEMKEFISGHVRLALSVKVYQPISSRQKFDPKN